MKSKFWLLGLALATLVANGVVAQDAPIPMPRPADRMPTVEASATGGAEATSPSTEVIVDPAPVAAETDGETADPALAVTAPADAVVDNPALAATEAVTTPALPAQPVTLTAQITENGMTIPEGLVWRVFDTRTDPDGELTPVDKSNDAEAHFQLPPGEYVVHVAYGRAQASDTLEVNDGGAQMAIVLDAGALRLNAAVTGDVSVPINLLRFDIYTPGTESSRTLVAQNLSANDIVTLNAGTYHVVSRFGAVNAVVRADLRVEPGQLTDATLYHRAAQISFRLVTEAGGEAIADVEWTVKSAAGDTVFSEISAFPATVLAEGDYVVLAKRGEQVYNREFEVLPGPSREIEVLTTVYQ